MGTRESAFQLLEPFVDQANERLKFASSKVRTLKNYPDTSADTINLQSSDTTGSGSDVNGELGTEPSTRIARAEDIGPDDIIIA